MNAEPPPNNQYICEARETGKPTHEFPTPDGEAARAMCDAHGWELIRVYQPGKDSDRPGDAPANGDLPLSAKQKKALVIEAKKTWQLLTDLGATDQDEYGWRHEQVKALVKRVGLSECQNSHYAKLLRHFKRLRGEKTVASPTGPQSGEGGDSLERREQMLALIAAELGNHHRRVDKPETSHEWACSEAAIAKGGKIGPGYMLGIARAKNPGCTIADEGALITLPASRLEHLLFTLRNRIAAREGRGSAETRDKGQKKRRGK